MSKSLTPAVESAPVSTLPSRSPSLLRRMASKFGVDDDKMMSTLKATAFKGDVSNEQMMALLIVAEQYNLNPWTKEIYAFPDKNNGIVPVVGVDGWIRIINSNPDLEAVTFEDGPAEEWITLDDAGAQVAYGTRADAVRGIRTTFYDLTRWMGG